MSGKEIVRHRTQIYKLSVAGAYVGFQVKSRGMFALRENHEFVKTLKQYRKLGFLQPLV